jgi:hypothetical protein
VEGAEAVVVSNPSPGCTETDCRTRCKHIWYTVSVAPQLTPTRGNMQESMDSLLHDVVRWVMFPVRQVLRELFDRSLDSGSDWISYIHQE